MTFANNAATQMFGRSVQELLGSQVVDLVALGPGETPALPAVLQGVQWRGDVTVSRGQDDDIVAEATVNPILSPDGEVVGAIAALEDMTEIRRTEAEAAEGEVRLRLAHAAAELGTWHWNALDGTNVWDDQMHRIYGLPPGGFDGTWDAWVASIHPDDREEAIGIVQQAMGNLSSYVLRNRIVRPDGRPCWIEAHGKVLVGPDGGPAGTIGCLQDVTARILMEQQQADAAARALLLQQVTGDFSEARTPDQVAAVHTASLERVRQLISTEPDAPGLRGGRPAARHAGLAARDRGRARRPLPAHHERSPRSCSSASRRARCRHSSGSRSRRSTHPAATTSSTSGATGTTPSAPRPAAWSWSSAMSWAAASERRPR